MLAVLQGILELSAGLVVYLLETCRLLSASPDYQKKKKTKILLPCSLASGQIASLWISRVRAEGAAFLRSLFGGRA